jgi:succinate dehydrogenase assembly factor 2
MLLHQLRPTASSLRTLPLLPRRATQTTTSATSAAATTIIARRAYMGGAGEMKSRRDSAAGHDDAIAIREQKLWDAARPRYDEIMERHVRLPVVEDGGGGDGTSAAGAGAAMTTTLDVVRRKRLVYRSKQRGWLEVDLLLGTWASMNVPGLSAGELDEFEEFVNMETIDIYNVLTLRSDVPEGMGGGGGEGGAQRTLVERIQDWCKESPLGKADKDKYEEVKTKNNLI